MTHREFYELVLSYAVQTVPPLVAFDYPKLDLESPATAGNFLSMVRFDFTFRIKGPAARFNLGTRKADFFWTLSGGLADGIDGLARLRTLAEFVAGLEGYSGSLPKTVDA